MTAVLHRPAVAPTRRIASGRMRILVRDGVALLLLAAGAILAVVLWPLSPWFAPGALLLSAMLASGVYRARRPAVTLRGPVRIPQRDPVPVRRPARPQPSRSAR